MKAMVYTKYGPPEVLRLQNIEDPKPGSKEVLVKVHATTVTIGDTIMRSLNIPGPYWQRFLGRLYLGFRTPKRPILGMELAGVIETVGSNVTRFKPGDPVFASTFAVGFGGYAEYKCIPEKGVIAIKPDNLSFEEAAAVPGGAQTALQCLKKANIQPGQKVLVYGASGAVGTSAVQLAKNHFGAEVTGVCSTRNVDLVASLGASTVVDYTREDFTESDQRYDVVFDAVGKLTTSQKRAAIRISHTYLNVLADSNGSDSLENLLLLKSLIEAGQFKPVIDCHYPFEQLVEAHRYVERGHKRGNVSITLNAPKS